MKWRFLVLAVLRVVGGLALIALAFVAVFEWVGFCTGHFEDTDQLVFYLFIVPVGLWLSVLFIGLSYMDLVEADSRRAEMRRLTINPPQK